MGSAPKKWEWDDHFDFPRDLIGYGEKSFNPKWPNGAKVAISFVINYEEGAEQTVMNGDGEAEASKPASSETNSQISNKCQRRTYGTTPAAPHASANAPLTSSPAMTTVLVPASGASSASSTNTI